MWTGLNPEIFWWKCLAATLWTSGSFLELLRIKTVLFFFFFWALQLQTTTGQWCKLGRNHHNSSCLDDLSDWYTAWKLSWVYDDIIRGIKVADQENVRLAPPASLFFICLILGYNYPDLLLLLLLLWLVSACKLNTQIAPSKAQGVSWKKWMCETERAW